ncbi:MAG: sugar transferase [Frankiales bacterium]|nr:sugar transferase [Frankiales bacterium]
MTEASTRRAHPAEHPAGVRRDLRIGVASPSRRAPRNATAALADINQTPATRWLRDYKRTAVAADLVVILLADLLGMWLRFGIWQSPAEVAAETKLSFHVAIFAVPLAWMLATASAGCYDVRFLGTGSDEFKRMLNACVRVAAGIGLVCYLSKTDLSRGYVATTLFIGTIGLGLSRYALRKYVHRLRRKGKWSQRVLAVGTGTTVAELVQVTRAEPYAGFTVVAACLSNGSSGIADALREAKIPVLGGIDAVDDAVRLCEADTVAVTTSPEIGSKWLTRLAWRLEGSGVALAVAPALTNVAGPRIAIRPVAGLPLLHVEEPELSGGARLVKTVFERVLAAVALFFLAPAMLLVAIGIKVDSAGPVFFRQERVGQNGKPFRLFKFRSMREDAERVIVDLRGSNEADPTGYLFKIRRDPRVTRVGRWIRRYSIDELPQLVNVLRGDMALVGPRPPLPSEVERYGADLRRRLVVKPGITGLWQVSGRSDLSWDDAVRLDLYYVENWSLALDLQILWKTVFAVALARGAY